MFIISILGSPYAYADDFGRSKGKGYFYGKSGSGKFNDDYNVLKNGIDKSDIRNAKAFYEFIRGRYNSGSEQDKTGAAFIVNTMVGNKAPGYGKSISDSEWDDFKGRIETVFENGEVNWTSYTICGKTSSYYQKSNKDDAFYDLDKDDVVKAMGKKKADSYCKPKVAEFKYGGKTLYRIAEDCANPVGSLNSLPKAKKWFIKASTSVNRATAAPGQILNWDHKIWNDGPDSTTKSIHSNVVMSGFSNGWNGTYADADKGSGVGDGNNVRTDFGGYDDDYTVTQNDVGNNLCEKVQYDPTDWLGGNNGSSSNKCVSVPYNYSLDPKIGFISDVVDSDTSTTIPTAVTNNGPTKSRNTSWDITQVIVNPGKNKLNELGGNSNMPACGNYFRPAPPDGSCSVIASGNNKVFGSNGARSDGSVIPPTPDTSISGIGKIGDLPVGTKICYAISVRDRSDSSNEWRHSPLRCMTVGKKPKVQIWAGDLSTQGSVQTINTVKTIAGKSTTFGSWGEYGIFAKFSINSMGSGSAFAGAGLLNAQASGCNYSFLSFTNAGSSTCGSGGSIIGGYTVSRSIPDVAASFSGAGSDINVGSVEPDKLIPDPDIGTYIGTRTGDGNLELTVSNLKPGKSIIIKASGTVTIAGNQTYNPDNKGAKYTNGSQLPQLVIIADKIIINSTVTNVDAWLVATGVNGVVETCDTVSLPSISTYILSAAPIDYRLTSNKCNQPLVVNGPVMAKQLWLRRTAGSGTGAASGDPAEVFNLRADTYLWAMARAISNGHIQTVHTTELPPRF